MTLQKRYVMNLLLKLSTILFLLLLGGCANTYQPIHKYPLNKYDTATIVSNVPQQEIRLQIDGEGIQFSTLGLYLGGAGGLFLGLALDAGISEAAHNKAKARVAKFKDVLNEQPTSDLISEQIRTQAAILPWVSRIDFFEHYLPQNEFRKEIENKIYSGDILIVVETQYSFTPKFETIEMLASYSIHEKNSVSATDELGSDDSYFKPFYKNIVMFQADVFSTQKTRRFTETEREEARMYLEEEYRSILASVKNRRRREAILVWKARQMKSIYDIRVPIEGANIEGSRWLQENAAAAKEALKEGAKEIARMIKLDLNGMVYSTADFPVIEYAGHTVQVIERDEEHTRVIFRIVKGGYTGALVSKQVDSGYSLIPKRY